MDVADTNLPTTTKDRIHIIYMGLARATAHLQAWTTGNTYEDGFYIFMDFRKGLLELYELSKRYELNEEIKSKMQKWIKKEFKTMTPEKNDVWEALELYSELVDALINLGKLDV